MDDHVNSLGEPAVIGVAVMLDPDHYDRLQEMALAVWIHYMAVRAMIISMVALAMTTYMVAQVLILLMVVWQSIATVTNTLTTFSLAVKKI